MGLVFLDTETTGLDPLTEDIFEIALITEDGREHVWRIEPDEYVIADMHPKAAEVNRYHERIKEPGWTWDDPYDVGEELHGLLQGQHLVGAVPDFDARFLEMFLGRFHDADDSRPWHYHLIDVEPLAIGYLRAIEKLLNLGRTKTSQTTLPVVHTLPWDSDTLSLAVGVTPPDGDGRHTALADARWARAVYYAVMGDEKRRDGG